MSFKEMKTLKHNQTDILQLKNSVNEMKDAFRSGQSLSCV